MRMWPEKSKQNNPYQVSIMQDIMNENSRGATYFHINDTVLWLTVIPNEICKVGYWKW